MKGKMKCYAKMQMKRDGIMCIKNKASNINMKIYLNACIRYMNGLGIPQRYVK